MRAHEGRHAVRAFQVGEPVGLERGVDVQLAALDPALGRYGVIGRIVVDPVHTDVGGVEEARVLRQLDMVAQPPCDRAERAIGNVVGGLGPGVPPALDGVARYGIHARVLGDLGQVGGRVLERQLQREVAQGPRAEARGVQAAPVHRLGVLQEIQQIGVGRGRVWIQQAAEGVDEIVGGDGRPVRPDGGPQVESPDQAIRRGLPRPGDPRDRLAVGSILHQAHHDVAQDVALADQADLLGIERGRVGAVAVLQADLAGRAGRALHARAAAGQHDQRSCKGEG